ncbi:MAG: Dihydroorotate dehydrogenase (quinone), mitochondrial [Pycnora praestabilis]|nr:MAG: Dihydroorotate dehydrogenase (quinone), mitochondrial [Pycnora praestabilis]
MSSCHALALRQVSQLSRRPLPLHLLPSFSSRPTVRGPSALSKSVFSRSSIRSASTSSDSAGDSRSLVTRLKNLLLGTSIAVALAFGYYYITDTRAGVHQWVVVPSLRWLYDDAEDAHEAGTTALKVLHRFGIHPRERGNPDGKGDLEVEVFGHTLCNPIGTSAGIDKHADIPSPLLALGPAIIEVGGATPYPQDGNPKPRVFRLPSQNALINRYGLNSEGAEYVAMRLRQRVREYAYAMGLGIDEEAERIILDGEAGVPPGSLVKGKLMAVQIAKNKFTPDDDIEAVKRDYVFCVDELAKYADIIVVNVSSPNTPGLRSLQRMEPLTNILTGVVEAARKAQRKTSPKVMVKVSPDEDSEEQVGGICDAIWESGVDGVIVGNTTKRRPDPLPMGYTLPEKEAAVLLEQGGYSGPQLFESTLALVKRYRRLLDEGPREQMSKSERPKDSLKPRGGPTSGVNPDAGLLEKIEASKNSSKPSGKSPTRDDSQTKLAENIEAGRKRDEARLKAPTDQNSEDSKSQSLIRLPQRNSPFASNADSTATAVPLSASHHLSPELQSTFTTHSDHAKEGGSSLIDTAKEKVSSAVDSVTGSLGRGPSPLGDDFNRSSVPAQPVKTKASGKGEKVIFATGGITNGKQALEILEAGSNVAQIYTALVYGGLGTVSRIKGELREEMRKRTS